MRIETVPGGPGPLAQRAAIWVADQLWSAIAERDVAHLAVSGGTTPKAMFGALATLPLPWDRVHVWQVDERVAPDGDPARNLDDLEAALLSKVPATPHLFAVTNPDLAAAAAAYAADLHAACDGVLDVVHLGLGDDGHTASWPPGDPVVDVTDADAAVVRAVPGPPAPHAHGAGGEPGSPHHVPGRGGGEGGAGGEARGRRPVDPRQPRPPRRRRRVHRRRRRRVHSCQLVYAAAHNPAKIASVPGHAAALRNRRVAAATATTAEAAMIRSPHSTSPVASCPLNSERVASTA